MVNSNAVTNTASRLASDGLWRCLCPSFETKTFSTALRLQQTLLLQQPGQPYCQRSRRRPLASGWAAASSSRRGYHAGLPHRTKSAASKYTESAEDDDAFAALFRASTRPALGLHSSESAVPTHEQQVQRIPTTDPATAVHAAAPIDVKDTNREGTVAKLVKCAAVNLGPLMQTASNDAIEQAMRQVAATKLGFDKVLAMVRFVIQERRCEPRQVYYECLAKVMSDPRGSATCLWDLLEEMEALGVPRTTEFCQATLQALAIHPDYVLRAEILNIMHEHWISPSISDREHIVLGMLRDKQYELALDELDRLLTLESPQAKLSDRISTWVLDISIAVLTQAEFFDEALYLILHRFRGGYPSSAHISKPLICFVIDACSRSLHYASTKYLWDRTDKAADLHLPDGVLTNILNTASRQGDAALATEAFQALASRGSRMLLHHYEALIDLHAGNGAILDALRVLCIMASAGLPPDKQSTRSIYMAFCQQPGSRNPSFSPSASDMAVRILTELRESYRGPIPAAVIDVLLEVAVDSAGIAAALHLYRTAQQWRCPPTIQTFLPLVFHCNDPGTLASLATDFLAAAPPDANPVAAFYDKLIWGCAVARHIDQGFTLLELLRLVQQPRLAVDPALGANAAPTVNRNHGDPNWWMHCSSVLPLATRALEAGDARADALLTELEQGPESVAVAAKRIRARTTARADPDSSTDSDSAAAAAAADENA